MHCIAVYALCRLTKTSHVFECAIVAARHAHMSVSDFLAVAVVPNANRSRVQTHVNNGILCKELIYLGSVNHSACLLTKGLHKHLKPSGLGSCVG